MYRSTINIQNYWRVIVYFDIDYDLFNIIAKDLSSINCPYKEINNIYYNMHKEAKAFTFSNRFKHVSIVGFNNHATRIDYINSIVHESEHVKQAILNAYKVGDSGEPPAYTVGYIVMELYKIFSKLHH